MDRAMSTPFPLLTAIAQELCRADGLDERSAARIARRLLTDAYRAVDPQRITDPTALSGDITR
jgi:hypothetical protein